MHDRSQRGRLVGVLARSGVAVVVLALLTALAWPDLARPGYSPDEEFTVFAVRGIDATGLPLLPSGLLYDRGLAYSYGAWAAAALGPALPAARAVSVVCAALALGVLFFETRRLASIAAAGWATLLVATSLPFWVSATTGRFYAPFLLAYLWCLALMARPAPTWRGLAGLILVGALARWTHELAFTLAIVPFAAAALAPRDARRRWLMAFAAVVVGLAAGQIAIFAVHAAAPPTNGDVMVRRFFLWQVLNLFERPPLDLVGLLPTAAAAGATATVMLAWLRARQDPWSASMLAVGGLASSFGQLGVGPLAALVALPLVGRSAGKRLVGTSLAVLGASVAFWTIALVAAGVGAGDALARIAGTGFVYPLDMLAHLAGRSPWLVMTTLVALLLRAGGHGGAWTPHERGLHALWIGWVLWFGVIESGITARYLLLPVTFMLIAVAVDLTAVARVVPASRRGAWAVAAGALGLAVMAESWVGPAARERRWVVARPTLAPSALAGEIHADDLLVSLDELACVMTAGRIDAWLVLDDFFRERFVVMRDGQPTGTYTGAPAVPSLAPLLLRAEREQRRLIVVDVLKDVPGFGPTAGLVPRQLAREDLRGDVVAETPGLRLVQVRPARDGAVARIQPAGDGATRSSSRP